MLGSELNALRARLDALKEGRASAGGLWKRALGAFRGDDDVQEALAALRALDRDFDRAGIHTTADARLLVELGRYKGRIGDLARGLAARAEQALEGFALAVDVAERKLAAQSLPPGLVTSLEEDFLRLARVVKVAQLFGAPGALKGGSPFEVYQRPQGGTGAPDSARLAAIEFLVRRAQDTVYDVAQKRRDLDVAYELMLRVVASNKEDKDRLRQLRIEVSSARDRVRQTPVVRSLADTVRHLRHVARKDPAQAWRSVRGLYERALEAGDVGLTQAARGAVEAMLPAGPQLAARLEADAQSRLGLFGARAKGGAAELAAGTPVAPGGTAGDRDEANELLAQLAFELDVEQLETLELAAGCMQYFDVEDALSEELVEADLGARRPIQRRVPYPTQYMTYEHTGALAELPNFVISHPKLVVHDLASNRQQIRAYIEETPPPIPKQVKKTAVRVYVLDASGSMHGPRSRFRDAILIAELNAMRAKARAGQPFDPLYYSYFNDAPTSLARVDSAAEATRQIEKLFRSSLAAGQTDITLALISAFDSIRSAQGTDPYLARATVVLVTDGEDAVDLEMVRKTKRPLEGLDIALSFISLGEENPDLKALVLEQRQTGARAFYHHLSDPEIATARTEFDSTWRTLLPADVPTTPGLLETLLPHLEALEAIAQGLEARVAPRSDAQFEALFPETPAEVPLKPSAAMVTRLSDILDAVGDAASLASADARAGECVALLTHLLELYQVPMAAYLEALGSGNKKLAEAVARIRLLGRPFG